MAVDFETSVPLTAAESPLIGRRVAIVGRLSGMSRRDAARTIRRYGGVVIDANDNHIDMAVIADDQVEPPEFDEVAPHAAGQPEVLRESDLWQRLGLIDQADVRRLYTPAMLADLLDAPVAAIRRWHRQGALMATLCVRRLPYFDFPETAVARELVALLAAGCSLRMIDRRLQQLSVLLPDLERPLADPRVVVSGRRLYLRRGEDLAEPGGQLLLDFDVADGGADEAPAVISLVGAAERQPADFLVQLRQEALDCEDAGELQLAADAYRGILSAGGPTAEINFALADVLYRLGDLTAARERLHVAIEVDEEYVEARFSLGCVLAETGDYALAIAALEGTLRFHPDYADAHFHLARALECLDRLDEAARHYTSFLALAPESPWAAAARDRLAELSASPLSAIVQSTLEAGAE